MRRTTAGVAHGMTLMELMIVVIIIAILAAIALPMYQRAIERSHWMQARDMLHTIRAGEITYWSKADQYSANWADIFMDNPNGGPVGYAIAAGAGTGPNATFTATASSGAQSMTMNEAGRLDVSGWPEP
ncbi:MAG: prepilin-type N-terminal cleavage/methylation domain-containing protein [Candidatus Omnitrophica bacterium]|nr:prepilin-type N-terminal cleavage/methylation domain-containing protein [Candidatus Omnitrophota bacterium]